MNILRSSSTKLLLAFLMIIFLIGIMVFIIKIQSIFKFTGIQSFIFGVIFAIYYSVLSYINKVHKNYWIIIGTLLMQVIPSIIGLYIISRDYFLLNSYLFFIGLLIIFVFIIFFFVLRQSRLNNILVKQKNPELYIEKVEKLIQNSKNETIKYRWYLEKVRVLLIQKRFKEVVNILQEIEVDILENRMQFNYYVFSLECYLNIGNSDKVNNILNKLKNFRMESKKLQVYYVNSLLYYLTIMERLDEADEIYNQNSSILYSNSIESLNTSIKDTIASYKYYCGNTAESKKMFLQIDKERDENEKVSLNYFLGLIFLKEGKEDYANQRFEKVLKFGKDSYFYNKLIEEHKTRLNSEE